MDGSPGGAQEGRMLDVVITWVLEAAGTLAWAWFVDRPVAMDEARRRRR